MRSLIFRSQSRAYHRLSRTYTPTSKDDFVDPANAPLESLRLLQRAAFIRQSSAGIYSILPNGLRVLNNIENIIDDEMTNIGASKLLLPSILPSTLWEKSGRWESTGHELLRIQDRKGSDYLYAPTHEEEITDIVRKNVTSWRDLPVKVYQISRKFRDEARPRSGLLRTREFIMKDLYTFDTCLENARSSYNDVRKAYLRIFKRIGIPFIVAEADTGNMGGSTSHEFIYETPIGEDTVLSCKSCLYAANTEIAKAGFITPPGHEPQIKSLAYESPSTNTLIGALYDSDRELDINKIYKHYPDAKLVERSDGSRELDSWDKFKVIIDRSVASTLEEEDLHEHLTDLLRTLTLPTDPQKQKDFLHLETTPESIWPAITEYEISDIRVLDPSKPGDTCPRCGSKELKALKALEVGHTFILGTRYSEENALDASYVGKDQVKKPIEMGCYGIGVTRIMGSLAEKLKDERGLVWPTSIAPYKVSFIPTTVPQDPDHLQVFYKRVKEAVNEIIKASDFTLSKDDFILDDRSGLSFGSKMKDAELIGYSTNIVLGKSWISSLTDSSKLDQVVVDGRSRDGKTEFKGSIPDVAQQIADYFEAHEVDL